MKQLAQAEQTWRDLAQKPPAPLELFDVSSLHGLPSPARRWLTRVLPDSTPLVAGVVLAMDGQIRIGRWMPFTADQILRAGVGFVWKPVVGGALLRFVGADVLSPGDARMEFRWQGLIPVAKRSGPDVARSAAGRLAAETVAWLPQATTPQAGARWIPIDDERAVVSLETAGEWTDVEVSIDRDGRLRELRLERWNDSAKPPASQTFGGEVTGEHVMDGGVRIARSGAIGWGYPTAAWPDGEFFRFSITSAAAIEAGSTP